MPSMAGGIDPVELTGSNIGDLGMVDQWSVLHLFAETELGRGLVICDNFNTHKLMGNTAGDGWHWVRAVLTR